MQSYLSPLKSSMGVDERNYRNIKNKCVVKEQYDRG
jgi:hypothetical protein